MVMPGIHQIDIIIEESYTGMHQDVAITTGEMNSEVPEEGMTADLDRVGTKVGSKTEALVVTKTEDMVVVMEEAADTAAAMAAEADTKTKKAPFTGAFFVYLSFSNLPVS
jgi:hypothetical protein